MAYSLAFSQAIMIAAYIYIKTTLGHHDYLSTRAISEFFNIPIPTVTKVLRSLSNAGIVRTKEGVRGGMVLNQPPEAIKLYDIFEAVENKKPLFKKEFNTNLESEKANAVIKKIDQSLINAEISMKEELKRTTLDQIINAYF